MGQNEGLLKNITLVFFFNILNNIYKYEIRYKSKSFQMMPSNELFDTDTTVPGGDHFYLFLMFFNP